MQPPNQTETPPAVRLLPVEPAHDAFGRVVGLRVGHGSIQPGQHVVTLADAAALSSARQAAEAGHQAALSDAARRWAEHGRARFDELLERLRQVEYDLGIDEHLAKSYARQAREAVANLDTAAAIREAERAAGDKAALVEVLKRQVSQLRGLLELEAAACKKSLDFALASASRALWERHQREAAAALAEAEKAMADAYCRHAIAAQASRVGGRADIERHVRDADLAVPKAPEPEGGREVWTGGPALGVAAG